MVKLPLGSQSKTFLRTTQGLRRPCLPDVKKQIAHCGNPATRNSLRTTLQLRFSLSQSRKIQPHRSQVFGRCSLVHARNLLIYFDSADSQKEHENPILFTKNAASPMKRVQSRGWDLGMKIMPLPSALAPRPPRTRRAWGGRDLIERAVRPLFVAFRSPALDDEPHFPKRRKDPAAQAAIPWDALERLVVALLPGTPRIDALRVDPMIFDPVLNVLSNEFRTVVALDDTRSASALDELPKHPHDIV